MHKRIDIKLGYKCNNKCLFCVQGDKRVLCPDKTLIECKSILKETSPSYQEVVFTGGECTIRTDIIELVRYASTLGFKVHFQSNGRMFSYENFCQDIVLAGARYFTISVHGHTADLHDRLTGVTNSFQQTINGIKNLISSRAVVFTNTVITKLNYVFLPEIVNFLADLGIREFSLSFPHILGQAKVNYKKIIARKSLVSPFVIKAIRAGLKKNCDGKIEAMPLCFLKGYESYVKENFIPETKVFDTYAVENFNDWRKKIGKIKGEKCQSCKLFSLCEGPWREYPELFGWDEFCPVI